MPVADWQPYQTAPLDRPVWMFLPSAIFTTDAGGRPIPDSVKHQVVLAEWDAKRQHWVEHNTQRQIYPSLWSDAPNGGKPPAAPKI
jgi:hypothetical protein